VRQASSTGSDLLRVLKPYDDRPARTPAGRPADLVRHRLEGRSAEGAAGEETNPAEYCF